MRPGAALRVLVWRWGLSPGESQAAEYAARMGLPAFRRQWSASRRALRTIEKELAKRKVSG